MECGGPGGDLSSAVDAEFVEDVFDVGVDGADAHDQACGDVLVGGAGGVAKDGGDVVFAAGEWGCRSSRHGPGAVVDGVAVVPVVLGRYGLLVVLVVKGGGDRLVVAEFGSACVGVGVVGGAECGSCGVFGVLVGEGEGHQAVEGDAGQFAEPVRGAQEDGGAFVVAFGGGAPRQPFH